MSSVNDLYKDTVYDWIDDETSDNVEVLVLPNTISEMVVTHYINRSRVGISFRGENLVFPSFLLDTPIKSIIDKISEEGTVIESTEMKTPRITSNDLHVIAKLFKWGINLQGVILSHLSKKYNAEQMVFLSRYIFGELVKSKNYSNVNLRLKTNTAYYRQKAGILAGLQNGTGEWDLVAVDYYPNWTYCTLGHKIKYKFIVREKTTGEELAFGSTCIDDFFEVDNELARHLGIYKKYLIGQLVAYGWNSLNSNSANITIDKIVLDFGVFLKATNTRSFKKIRSFIENGLLIPESLQVSYLDSLKRGFDSEVKRVSSALEYLSFDKGGMYSLLLVGLFGNYLTLGESSKDENLSNFYSTRNLTNKFSNYDFTIGEFVSEVNKYRLNRLQQVILTYKYETLRNMFGLISLYEGILFDKTGYKIYSLNRLSYKGISLGYTAREFLIKLLGGDKIENVNLGNMQVNSIPKIDKYINDTTMKSGWKSSPRTYEDVPEMKEMLEDYTIVRNSDILRSYYIGNMKLEYFEKFLQENGKRRASITLDTVHKKGVEVQTKSENGVSGSKVNIKEQDLKDIPIEDIKVFGNFIRELNNRGIYLSTYFDKVDYLLLINVTETNYKRSKHISTIATNANYILRNKDRLPDDIVNNVVKFIEKYSK